MTRDQLWVHRSFGLALSCLGTSRSPTVIADDSIYLRSLCQVEDIIKIKLNMFNRIKDSQEREVDSRWRRGRASWIQNHPERREDDIWLWKNMRERAGNVASAGKESGPCP